MYGGGGGGEDYTHLIRPFNRILSGLFREKNKVSLTTEKVHSKTKGTSEDSQEKI